MTIATTSRRISALALAATFGAAACSPSVPGGTTGTPPGTTTAPATSTTTAPATTTSAPATTTSPGSTGKPETSVVGAWRSASCGDRAYPRELQLSADGTFESADLVSPCPPKAVCVWSGIVNRKGTFTVANGKLTLTPESQAAAPGRPLPTTLSVDPTTGAPVETPADGATCVYTRLEKKP